MPSDFEDSLMARPDVPEDEIDDTPVESGEDRLAKKLEELTQGVKESSGSAITIAKLVADPDIRKVLEARQQGKKVQISTDEELSQKPVEPSKDIEEMTNQELTQHLSGVINSQVANLLKKQLEPFQRQLEQVTTQLQSKQSQEVASEIQEVRKQYNDFDDYRQDMLQLNQSNPGLSVEELYLVAKRRKGGSGARVNDTERPSTVNRGIPRKRVEPKVEAKGRGGFQQLLADALERVPFPED